MQALRLTQAVSQDGFLHIQVPAEMGKRCEIIVLPLDDTKDTRNYNLAAMQERSGFVQQILGLPEEDVWNDL